MRTWNRTAVVVVPKQPVLDWLHSVDPTSTELTAEDLCKDPTVHLLVESNSDENAETLLAKSCTRIFEEQLDGWYLAPESWPEDQSIGNFRRWFSYTLHSMIIDLWDAPLVPEKM